MNPRIMALTFTALMLASTLPTTAATHANALAPDVPILPHARPDQDCMPVGIQEEVLTRVNQAIAGDPAFYRNDVGVPSICLGGGSLQQWEDFVKLADDILDNVRNASREIQRQVDYRFEATLPDSSYPNELVEPRTVLLNETFNGHRATGFGDWKIVTQKGEDPVWRLEQTVDVNATRHAYRFGNDDGYEQGVHQFLVSPEIDLTALKGNKTAVQDLVAIRDTARDQLRFTCNQFTQRGTASYGEGDLAFACGESATLDNQLPVEIHALIVAYEQAFDDTIATLPVMQHGAFLDVTYRMNLAPGEDGVRMWLYSGDRQPDRSVLFDDDLGIGDAYETCVHMEGEPTLGTTPAWPPVNGTAGAAQGYECSPTLQGGQVVSGLEGMERVKSFGGSGAANTQQNFAFTGDREQFYTARLNLTPWLEQRLWVLFEVKTQRDDRAQDIFNDTARFPRQKEYGFQLSRVYAEGDAYHRNFRVKDVAATYPHLVPQNVFADPDTTRTTTPPGDKPVVAWVHNAGDYVENGTVVVSVRAKEGNASVGSYTTLGSYETANLTFAPDEVKVISVPWGKLLTSAHPTLLEGWVYETTARIREQVNSTGSIPDQLEDNGEELPPAADPNATAVRPANAASLPGVVGGVGGAGTLQVSQLVRAATLRNVTLVRADRAPGPAIEFCSTISVDDLCEEHFAGRKGEPRLVQVGVRNDGNTAQNISVDLTVELDGIGKPDTVLDGPRRTAREVLPGEVRAVTWTVVASQPGAYRVVASPIPEVPAGAPDPVVRNAERRLFVQRSTGLICLDAITDRECGSSFQGEIVPQLRLEDVTAATLGADGTLYVATTVREAQDGVHSGQLAALDPSGAWKVIANLSATVLNANLAGPPFADHAYGSIRSISVSPTNGTIYLVGDNGTALRVSPTGGLARIPLNTTSAVNLTASLWYKGDLLVAGDRGVLAHLVEGKLEPFSTSFRNTTGVVPFTGTYTSLALGPDGAAVALGANGTLQRHDPTKNVNGSWIEVQVGGAPLAWATGNASLRGATTYAGRLVVAGGTSDVVVERGGVGVGAERSAGVGKFFGASAGVPTTMKISSVCAYAHTSMAAGEPDDLVDRDVVSFALSAAPGSPILFESTIKTGSAPGWYCKAGLDWVWTSSTLFLQRTGGGANVSFEAGGADDSYIFANGTWSPQPGISRPYRLSFAGPPRVLLASASTASPYDLRPLTSPPPVPVHAAPNFVGLATAHDGRLFLLDERNNLATCERCFDPVPTWSYPLPPRPSIVGDGAVHPAAATHLLADGARTFLLGEAGMVLQLVDEGEYDNLLDWSVVPSLAPRDGGVLQTRRQPGPATSTAGTTTWKEQTVLLIPDDEGRRDAQDATRFRLFLNHSMNWTGEGDAASGKMDGDDAFAELRLMYRPLLNLPLGDTGNETCSAQNSNDYSAVLAPICYADDIRVVLDRFDDETQRDGWEFKTYRDIPAAGPAAQAHPAPDQDPLGTWFHAIEIHATPKIRYAIDDIRLQGLVGSTWKDVTAWYGPTAPKNRGDWFILSPVEYYNNTVGSPTLPRQVYEPINNQVMGPTASQFQWEMRTEAPFDIATETPWHLTTQFADKPVFAANNAFYKEGYSDPASPRLLSNWDARLVSPVIDLSSAYDPVIEWRHAYAFRTFTGFVAVAGVSSLDGVRPGDGGFVEVQYLLQGEECGSIDVSVTCGWSNWYPVVPDGGYPTAAELGYGANLVGPPGFASVTGPPYPGRIGPPVSYWGRNAPVDETGRVSSTRLTETYQTARISLGTRDGADVQCTANQLDDLKKNKDARIDCIPANLTGRQVRVGFHLMTAGGYGHDGSADGYETDHTFNGTLKDEYSFPGEGWYITDFKVLGAKKLGIDLTAKDMAFRVGYDSKTIGVGPGTRVPVNVTVENLGTFDALGYTGTLEVRRVHDRALKNTTLVETIVLSQQPVLEQQKSVNHTIFWTVPNVEGAEYALRFTVTPIGIERDEDHLDNVVDLGTIAQPILAKTVRRFNAEFLVSPENATSDITRYIPMFVNNTGNVPLDGFAVERRITVTGRIVPDDATTCAQWQQRVVAGQPTAIVDCRTWGTQRPAPAGTLSPITLLSDEVSPTNDLFWKAPERATFLVSLSASTTVGSTKLSSATDKRVAAFATYLFDDIEGGPRGEAKSGNWGFGPSWSAVQPGFRSTDAYAFGDVALDRYPADTEGIAQTPTIDLGSARTALLALYHNFAFEPGFDGGVIEASDDGGKTWTSLTPLSGALTSASYNRTFPMQAASVLHPDGDPEKTAFAFTQDSRNLPSNVDGWVLSQVDLTDYANVTEPDVEYEAYHAAELARFSPPPTAAPSLGANSYFAPDWCVGAAIDGRCWESQNLTHGVITPQTPKPAGAEQNIMLWSGSVSRYDDGLRPVQNHLMEFEVDVSAVAEDQVVTADWWEYSDRFDTKVVYIDTINVQPNAGPNPNAVMTVHTFHRNTRGAETYRFNLGEPEIIETRGRWYHMRSDITELLDRLPDEVDTLTVGFAYTPIEEYSSLLHDGTLHPTDSLDVISNETTGNGGTKYYDRLQDDRGFIIDGFKIEATRLTGGQQLGAPLVLIDEAQVWEKVSTGAGGRIWECGTGDDSHTPPTEPPWQAGNGAFPGCFHQVERFIKRAPISQADVVGRTWKAVTSVPGVNSTWRVVDVKDNAGFSSTNPLPTGDTPKAWYTGDLGCRDLASNAVQGDEVLCPRPGSEARLVTPAFDLARIAGDNAQLSFWHRFAFYQRNVSGSNTPLASGGVVEISVLDAQTGTWSAWEQIYASDNFSVENGTTTKSPLYKSPLLPRRDHTRGGYTGFTANVSEGSDGVRRFDPPFKNLRAADRDEIVQFLFTGNSRTIERDAAVADVDGTRDGWLREEFDVTKYLGKRVRFGFHYAYAPGHIDNQNGDAVPTQLVDPDFGSQGRRTGWWISDVAVIGDVLVGKPVQLRFRAGTDGNVHDGHWLLDDIGVFGSRYRNNVGIFVDPAPGAFGAYNDSVAIVPVTIRNLGESVRRDLALEVRVAGTGATVSGLGPSGNETLEDKAFLLKGYTLGPGQSVTANVKVHTAAQGASSKVTLVLQLREANPLSATTPFGPITNNEVQGLLTRFVNFRIQNKGEFELLDSAIRQITPQVGQEVELVVSGRNPGFGPVQLEVECLARTITSYDPRNHVVSSDEHPDVVAEYPCAVSGKTTLAAKESTDLTFRATPTAPGFLQFVLKARIVGAGNLTWPTAGVPVGVPLVSYREEFDNAESLNGFSGTAPSAQWSHVRGHDELGALLIGINESLFGQTGDYRGTDGCAGMPCFATTPKIDLHNYSRNTPAYLSFWHMDRFAKFDGAQVRAQVLLNELKPNQEISWSDPCILTDGNYDGSIRHIQSTPPDGLGGQFDAGDPSTAYGAQPYLAQDGESVTSPPHFFTTPGGIFEESWSLAVFELPESCKSIIDDSSVPLLGRTARFNFMLFPSQSSMLELRRGLGQGWLIDEISVGPLALDVRPALGQRALLLDNTTKGFNVLLENLGSMPDVVRLEYDAVSSSAPEGSISIPSQTFTIQPGETKTVRVDVKLPRDPSLLPANFKARIVARSILDPNAAGATTLDLLFGPRQWPELSVSVVAPTGIVQEATEAFIPIAVENNGLVDSVNTRVKIVDEWPGGRVEHSLDLPSMPSYAQAPDEASRNLEFNWRPAKGSIGLHTLTFEVDPEILGEEYTRLNNVVQIVVPVSDLLIPDLHVASLAALTMRNAFGGVVTPGLDADVARYEVTAGEVVSLELKVANRGRAGATNVDVRAFIGALTLPSKTIPYIAPGSEAVVTFNWLAQKGEHEIEFLVRTEQVELTMGNNRYPGVGVTILTVKGYEIAVDLPNVDGLLSPASEIRVPFRITNSGNAGEDLVLRAKTPAGMRIMLPREGFFLRAGETYEDNARLILDAEAVAGEQFITIDAVARENPMKVASGRAAVEVMASYGGSVAGGFARGAPPELTIPIELVNEGNSLEPWKLILSLPAGWTSKETMPARVVVPAHDRLVYNFHVTLPQGTAPGDRVFAVKAEMPNGEKREGVARVGVMPLRAASVTLDEGAPKPVKGELTLPVLVQNTGNVREPFSVLLIDAPPGVEMRVEPAEFLLPPGGETIATLIVKPNASVEAGTYAITGYTRFAGVVPQTREGLANVQTLRVPIVRQELRVTAIEFSPRAQLDAGDRVTVKAFVQNFGQFEISNVPVHFFVDDVFIGEATLPSLAPGARADVTFNWTAITGVHTLTAVVDPYEDTVDGAREDNAVSAIASVGVDLASGAVAAGRADAPFGGAWIVVLALVAAMMVTRKFGSWRRERR